jgi:hypothetical protein
MAEALGHVLRRRSAGGILRGYDDFAADLGLLIDVKAFNSANISSELA